MKKEKTIRIELPAVLLDELKEITGRTTYKAAVEFVAKKTISANAAREIQLQAVIDGIKPKNRHKEIDSGYVGRERFWE